MKVLKRASQKNVELNKDFYNEVQIKMLLNFREVAFLDENLDPCYSYSEYVANFREPILRVFLDYGDKIEVQLNDGCYTNVLIKTDGTKYFIIL